MAQIQDFLFQYIKPFDFIEGIIISDREGIDIFSAYRSEDSPLKENQAVTMFVAGLTGSNENLTKLSQTKIQGLILFYDNYVVYVESISSYFLTMFCKVDSNVSMIKQIAGDIKNSLSGLSAELDKLNANMNKL